MSIPTGYDGFDDSLGRAVMLTATERMTQALEILHRFNQLSWEDIDDLITVGVWQEDRAKQFFAMAHKARDSGAKAPSAIVNFEVELRMAIANSFHAVDHAGGISGLGSMVFIPDRGPRSFRIYNPTILTANFHEGNFGRIGGLPGKGKTNTGCVILEQWHKEGNVAIANIAKKGDDPRYIFARSAKEFFIAIANLEEKLRWLFVLDEAGLMYSKPDQATRRVKDLDKLMRVIRKLHGSIILIEQRPESVPNIIQEFASSIFYCEKPGTVSIELKGPSLAFRDRVKDFPKTSLPFDTYGIAYWNIDVDINKLFSVMSGSDDPKKTIREYFEQEQAPTQAYLEKTCKRAGCGKSLVGLHPAAKYCSQGCRQMDYELRRRMGIPVSNNPPAVEDKKESLDEFLQ